LNNPALRSDCRRRHIDVTYDGDRRTGRRHSVGAHAWPCKERKEGYEAGCKALRRGLQEPREEESAKKKAAARAEADISRALSEWCTIFFVT